MTRSKGDSDGWLTDPISRDRVIAKSVVEGMRTITQLLREIRDDLTATNLEMRIEMRSMNEDIADLRRQVVDGSATPRKRNPDVAWEHCSIIGCSLPPGHLGNHRGSRRGVRRVG